MNMHKKWLFFFVVVFALQGVHSTSAQESAAEIKQKLRDIENRIQEARRQEQELLQQQDALFRQLLSKEGSVQNKRKEALERMAKERAWTAKNRPTIEMRAKLQYEVYTSGFLIDPPITQKNWFVMMDGQRVSLNFDKSAEPRDIRSEQEVEVLIKGKLEVRSAEIMTLNGPAERILIPKTLVIHVDSLTKAAAK